MKEATRFYLNREGLGLIKLCWFHENKESEMMFGFCGLSFKQACFANQYEDKYVTREEMRELRINYRDAKLRQQRQLIDHFIMHEDGVFHLKLKSGDEKYVHKVKLLSPVINDEIGEFLDFFIISDISSKYNQIIKRPNSPFTSISVKPNNFVVLRGRFSGAKFNLEQTVVEEERLITNRANFTLPGILFNGKILKGIFTYQIIDSKGIDFSNRPEGTYVLIAFPVDNDKFLVKNFVFN